MTCATPHYQMDLTCILEWHILVYMPREFYFFWGGGNDATQSETFHE